MIRDIRSLVIALAVVCVSTAHGQLITNGGFEAPGFTPSPNYYMYLSAGLGTQNAITGWTNNYDSAGEESFWMKAGGPYNALIGAGSYGLALNPGDLFFTSFSVVTGQTYAVSFLSMANVGITANALQVTANGQSALFTPSTSSFTTYSYNFTANTTGSVNLSFQLSAPNSPVFLDSASVTAIPEPSAYAALAGIVSLVSAVVCRRRKVA
jgi:hypothetical protein